MFGALRSAESQNELLFIPFVSCISDLGKLFSMPVSNCSAASKSAAEVSPTRVLELLEVEVPRARSAALYAVAAWEVSVSQKLIPSFEPLDVEADKA